MLFLDGVYIDSSHRSLARFSWVKAPTSEDPPRLTHTIAQRVARYLERHVLIARRVGKLAGSQSSTNSWLYYLRDLWVQYLSHFNHCRSWLARPLCSFFRWYVPRYRSLSLGVVSRSELRADIYAMQAINDRDVARAIGGRVMIDDYLTRTFWPDIVETARSSMSLETMPPARMADLFQGGLPACRGNGCVVEACCRKTQ